LAHRHAATFATLDAVAHYCAAARECEQDVGFRDAMLLLIRFEKNVSQIPVFAELFELLEGFDHLHRWITESDPNISLLRLPLPHRSGREPRVPAANRRRSA